MDVNEAIASRRSISRFLLDPVPAEQLARLLAAGVWAPNHHLTEPWTFVVIGPETRAQLAERYGVLRAERIPVDSPERRERTRRDGIAKFMGIPNLVAIVCDQLGDAQRQAEDYAATCCAVQNIQLAAWAEGVGMKWSTSGIIHDALTYELLGLDSETQRIIGLLYIGYPTEIPVRPRKKPLEDVIIWTE